MNYGHQGTVVVIMIGSPVSSFWPTPCCAADGEGDAYATVAV